MIQGGKNKDFSHKVVYRIELAKLPVSQTDGLNGLSSVMAGLDYFSELGVDILWLTDGAVDNKPAESGTINPIELAELQAHAKRHGLEIICGELGTSNYIMADNNGDNNKRSARLDCAKRRALLTLSLPLVPVVNMGQELAVGDEVVAIPTQWDDNDDSDTLANFYQRMIRLRKSSLALQDGELVFVPDRHRVMSYLRNYGEQVYLVVINLSGRTVRPKTKLVGSIAISTYAQRADLSDQLLMPYEGVVLKL